MDRICSAFHLIVVVGICHFTKIYRNLVKICLHVGKCISDKVLWIINGEKRDYNDSHLMLIEVLWKICCCCCFQLKSKARALALEIKKREKLQVSLDTWKKKFQDKESAREKLQSAIQETLCGQKEALKLHEEKQKALQEELQNKVSEISGLRDLARTHETNLQETQQKVGDLQEVLEAAIGELNALRDMEEARDKEFEELKCQSTEAKQSLTNQLQEKEEQLATSSKICDRLQGDVASLKRCMEEQRSKHVVSSRASP